MNEQQWLQSNSAVGMLDYLYRLVVVDPIGPTSPPSNRKIRLFNCALVRQVWDRLTEPLSKQAVEAGERYADGKASVEQRRQALYAMPTKEGWLPEYRIAGHTCFDDGWQQWRPLCEELNARGWLLEPAQANTLREVMGNPFRHVTVVERFPSRWPNREYHLLQPWLTPAVVSIAQAAYDERDNDGLLDGDRLAVLADSLEDAGCEDERVLRHLRGLEACYQCEIDIATGKFMTVAGATIELDADWKPKQATTKPAYLPQCRLCHGTGWRPQRGPHVRGCWALDLLLGKE